MQKILMVGMTYPLEGGSERHIYELSSRIKNSTVLTQEGSACKRKIQVPLFFSQSILRNLSFALFSSLYLMFLLIKPGKKYDVIHIHENTLYFLAPFLRIRYKVVITVHGIKGFKFHDNKYLWLIFEYFLGYANNLIAVSAEDEKNLKKDFKEVTFVPNGVDLTLYPSVNPKVSRKITFVGRIHEQKGVIYLLKAFDNFSKRYPDFTLELIGGLNDYSNQLQRRFPSKNIIWKGYISSRKALIKELKSSYMVVLPSLWEGLPLTLFESLASGRPLIVSNIPAFTSIVKDEALMFKSKDSQDLEEKISILLENPDKCTQLGNKGKKLAAHYSWESIAKKTERVYNG